MHQVRDIVVLSRQNLEGTGHCLLHLKGVCSHTCTQSQCGVSLSQGLCDSVWELLFVSSWGTIRGMCTSVHASRENSNQRAAERDGRHLHFQTPTSPQG